jgi:hypothetical protein
MQFKTASPNPGRLPDRRKGKSVLDLSAQDASAALPQNCQTTRWILRPPARGVNVTLVIGIYAK